MDPANTQSSDPVGRAGKRRKPLRPLGISIRSSHQLKVVVGEAGARHRLDNRQHHALLVVVTDGPAPRTARIPREWS